MSQEIAVMKNMGSVIQEKDLVLLWFNEDEVSYMIEVEKEKKFPIHKGRPLEVGEWIGKEFGSAVDCTHGRAYLLKPSTEDLMMKASRESGIIYPKDAGLIMMRAGIRSGQKILEVGTGSGALSLCLAQMVAPLGEVHTFDRREDLPKVAEKNLRKAGLLEKVFFHQRVSGAPFPGKDFDAAILDIPTPWEEVAVVRDALKGGGTLISLNPTFNQIERMAEALRANGFIRVEAGEVLYREILAREGKTRPVMRMCAHTEFILSAVKADTQVPVIAADNSGTAKEEEHA